ncbi:MAG: hypothetical protein JTT12_06285 [Candidatus Brockarchaeota archaeon]|nr:hypothetical protein [Candidatus Brockarchaeota archaeon]
MAGRITYGPFGIPQVNLFGIIIVIIGCFIIALGAIATLLKVSAEIIAEEVEKRIKPSSS